MTKILPSFSAAQAVSGIGFLGAALIMGVAAFASYKLIYMILSSNSIATLVSIMFAAAVYFVAAFRTGAVTKEEVELIPKGELLYRLAVKLRVAK